VRPLRSRVDRKSADYAERREANLADVEKLERALAKARDGGGEK
jgi:hypothetical protein